MEIDKNRVNHLLSHAEVDFGAEWLANLLVQEWIPALNGIHQRLVNGGRVADIVCGNGASTLIMSRAFPKACFAGFDPDRDLIRLATALAAADGLSNRVQFDVSAPDGFVGGPYDLVTSFGSIRRMGDPAGCAKRVWNRLAPNGSWMIVEPLSSDLDEGSRLRKVVMSGGFSRLRRVAHSTFHLVLEAAK